MSPAALALVVATLAGGAAAGPPAASAATADDTALRVASRLAHGGPRPAGSRAEGRAHALVKRIFRRARLRVRVQRFPVRGHGRSRNVIGVLDTPGRCLRVVMAHADTTQHGPGANDNASGIGVLAALAPRLETLSPECDVWLVATGAEERVYTGSSDHLGALALARLVHARARSRLRWALSLDEVGRGAGFWLRSPVPRARRRVEGEILRAARGSARWVRDDGSGNSDHREFQLLGMPAAKLGAGSQGEPCRHRACDRAGRLERPALRRARLIAEQVIRAN